MEHPPGTRLVGEAERRETIEELQDAKYEIINTLNEMPESTTIRQNYQKEKLEGKLEKLESVLARYMKPPVYIRH